MYTASICRLNSDHEFALCFSSRRYRSRLSAWSLIFLGACLAHVLRRRTLLRVFAQTQESYGASYQPFPTSFSGRQGFCTGRPSADNRPPWRGNRPTCSYNKSRQRREMGLVKTEHGTEAAYPFVEGSATDGEVPRSRRSSSFLSRDGSGAVSSSAKVWRNGAPSASISALRS
jgi:hypothetical protein